jgi:hypothetical protein
MLLLHGTLSTVAVLTTKTSLRTRACMSCVHAAASSTKKFGESVVTLQYYLQNVLV